MKALLAVAALLIGVVVGSLAWMGLFAAMPVTEQVMGPYPFVYVQEASTDSKKIGQKTEALGKRLEATGFTQRKPAQVFYPQDRGIQNQIGFVTDRPVTRATLDADDYFRPIPSQNFLVARFPFHNSLSYVLGAGRAESAFADYRTARKYSNTYVIVILDGDTILYLQPVEGA